jgi:hypothetical protein
MPSNDGFTVAQGLAMALDQKPSTQDDYQRKLGEGVMNAVLGGVGEIVQKALGATVQMVAPKNGEANEDALERTLRTLAMTKAVKALSGEDAQPSPNGKEESSLARAMIDAQTNMTKILLDYQAKAEERIMNVIREIREEKSKSSDPVKDLLANLGVQMLQSQMNRNPMDELIDAKEKLEKILGRPLTRDENADLERELAHKKLELEEKKIEAEKEMARMQADQQRELLTGALGALAARGAGAGAATATVDVPRYQCGACGEEFIMRTPRPTAICPACGVVLDTSGGKGAAPPGGAAPANVQPPAAPPPPPPAAGQEGEPPILPGDEEEGAPY